MSKACEPMIYSVNCLEFAIFKGMEPALSADLDDIFTVASSHLGGTYYASIFDPFEDLARLDLGNFDWLSAQSSTFE
jgi:hypothetical protein